MIYIIFDLEWNMASGHYEEVGKPRITKSCTVVTKKRIPIFEIFQIGAVSLSSNLQIKEHYSALIRPQIYPQINKYVQRLTKVKKDELKVSPPFTTVIYDFYAWIWRQFPEAEQMKACEVCQLPYDKIAEQSYGFSELQALLKELPLMFGTWSTSDAKPLRENLNYYALPNSLPAKFIDIQKLYELFSGDEAGAHAVKRAVDFLTIEPDEAYHDALNDALYTALIFQNLEPAFKFAAWDYHGLPLSDNYNLKAKQDPSDNFKAGLVCSNLDDNNEPIKLSWPRLHRMYNLVKKTTSDLSVSLGLNLSDTKYRANLKAKRRQNVLHNCMQSKYNLKKIDDKLEARLHLLTQADLEAFICSFAYDANPNLQQEHGDEN